MALIHDLTDEFKAPGLDWSAPGRSFLSQFSEAVRALRLGLYASLYANPSPNPVFDRNGPGKLFMEGNGNTFKYGKFEGGVAERHKLNHVHLHRRLADGKEEPGIFSNTLTLLLVLDLSKVDLGPDAKALRAFETYWNRGIRAFLQRYGFADRRQDGRSESRYLIGVPPTKSQLLPVLSELGEQICAAVEKRGCE
ncbi:hypothetical protein [Sorangium sp. So ce1389]|uniref:hypothetical protein n=1 Tax=Sorangium sp. So ce1389 TaxID=3133336 RepID=UPI003F641245